MASKCEQGKAQERAAGAQDQESATGAQAGAGLCVGWCAFLVSANFSKKLS